MAAARTLGVTWGVLSALGSALFLIPWKLASQLGPPHVNLLLLLLSSAVLNTLAFPLLRKLAPATISTAPRWTLRRNLWLALQLALLTFLGNWASATAIVHLSAPLLSVLQRVEVLVIALSAWAMLRERIDGRFWIGTSIAGAGLLLIQHEALRGAFGPQGVFYGLCAAIAFGLMSVLARHAHEVIDPVMVNSLRLWLSVLLWFLVNGVPAELAAITREQVLYASTSGLFGPVLSRLCMMYAVRYMEARVAALAALSAPVMTLVLSYLWFSELPSAQAALGGALMLVGIAVPLFVLRRRMRL